MLAELAGNLPSAVRRKIVHGELHQRPSATNLLEKGCQRKLLTAGCCWPPHTARAGHWSLMLEKVMKVIGVSPASGLEPGSKMLPPCNKYLHSLLTTLCVSGQRNSIRRIEFIFTERSKMVHLELRGNKLLISTRIYNTERISNAKIFLQCVSCCKSLFRGFFTLKKLSL